MAGTPENPDIVFIPEPTELPIVDPYLGVTGYVWDELQNHTHIQDVLADPTRPIDLSSLEVDTEFIDLEVTGLPSSLGQDAIYTLTGTSYDGSPQNFIANAGDDGRAVFWTIPPIAMDLTLRSPQGFVLKEYHFTGGDFCPDLVCTDPNEGDGTAGAGGSGSGGSGGSGGGGSQNNNPTSYSRSEGRTLLQAAGSTTSTGKVTVQGCWNHAIKVTASASGGLAAKWSGGGTLSYTKGTCDTITSQGQPVKETLADTFEKATFRDWSYKIFGKTKGQAIYVENWYVAFSCSTGTMSCFEKIVISGCNSWTRTVNESGSGTATVGVGWETPVWGVTGKVSVTATASSTVRWDLRPTNCSAQTYYIGVLAGNRLQTGLIGIVRQ